MWRGRRLRGSRVIRCDLLAARERPAGRAPEAIKDRLHLGKIGMRMLELRLTFRLNFRRLTVVGLSNRRTHDPLHLCSPRSQHNRREPNMIDRISDSLLPGPFAFGTRKSHPPLPPDLPHFLSRAPKGVFTTKYVARIFVRIVIVSENYRVAFVRARACVKILITSGYCCGRTGVKEFKYVHLFCAKICR
jgi:hypothetical protein